ncbi:hypothetical protein EDD86DRAFT_243617 [Gorgonomyces haynaldii]|nr:hypothetical protein EDD86DRAFT_243617 [Gorgonomyces haynaldii]
MTFVNALSLILLGNSFGFVKIHRGVKLMNWMMFTNFVFVTLYLSIQIQIQQFPHWKYNTVLLIIANVCDAFSGLLLEIAYVRRMQQCLISTRLLFWSNLLYVYPILYPIADAYQIWGYFDPSMSSLSDIVWAAMNIGLAVQESIVHVFFFREILSLCSMSKTEGTYLRWLLVLLGFYLVGFVTMLGLSIVWTSEYIDDLIYLFWTLNLWLYVPITREVVRLIESDNGSRSRSLKVI